MLVIGADEVQIGAGLDDTAVGQQVQALGGVGEDHGVVPRRVGHRQQADLLGTAGDPAQHRPGVGIGPVLDRHRVVPEILGHRRELGPRDQHAEHETSLLVACAAKYLPEVGLPQGEADHTCRS